jgi:hypothetical protein
MSENDAKDVTDKVAWIDEKLEKLHLELAYVYRTDPRATVLIDKYWTVIDGLESDKAYFEGIGTYVSDHGN